MDRGTVVTILIIIGLMWLFKVIGESVQPDRPLGVTK